MTRLAKLNAHLSNSSTFYESRQYNKSILIAKKGLELALATKDRKFQFQFFAFLISNYFALNNIDSMKFYINKAESILNNKLEKSIPDYVIGYYLTNYIIYKDRYELNLATNYCLKALKLSNKYRKPELKKICLSRLAIIYNQSKDFEKAKNIYEIIKPEQMPLTNEKINLLSAEGWNEVNLKNYNNAVDAFKLALNENNKLNNKVNSKVANEMEILLNYNLGHAYSLKNDYLKSETHLNKAIEIAANNGIKKSLYLAWCFEQKAKNKLKLALNTQSIIFCQKAIIANVIDFDDENIWLNPSNSNLIIGKNTQVKLLALKGEISNKILEKTNNKAYLKLSAKSYFLSIIIGDSYRKEISNYNDKISFTQALKLIQEEAIKSNYNWYLQTITQESANACLNIFESTNAVYYNDLFFGDNGNISPKLLKSKDSLLVKKATFMQDLVAGRNEKIENEIIEIDIALEKLDNANISNAKQIINYNNLTIKEITSQLPKNTSFISYTISNGGNIYVLLANKNHFFIKKLNVSINAIAGKIEKLLAKIKVNPGLTDYNGNLEAVFLYNQLIKPFEFSLQDSKRLVICKEGVLNELPFEILEKGTQKNDFLNYRFAITSAISITDYLQKQDYDLVENKEPLNIMPFTMQHELPNGKKLAALSNPMFRYKNEYLLVGKDANKRNFIEKIKTVDIVNFITHSEINQKNARDSKIYFYPDTTKNDSFLGFYEILNLNLKNKKLILIASCNSANGVLEAHEGVISLSYAFMCAGSQAVVGGRWPAHNRATSFITKRFQTYLESGHPKDVALQQAKIDFLKSSKNLDLAHPYYWANLGLIGNNNPIYSTQNNYSIWVVNFFIVIVSIVILCKLFLYFANKRPLLFEKTRSRYLPRKFEF